jgi:hypothetical protein
VAGGAVRAIDFRSGAVFERGIAAGEVLLSPAAAAAPASDRLKVCKHCGESASQPPLHAAAPGETAIVGKAMRGLGDMKMLVWA